METILIATDFSEASRCASFYGMKLAQVLGAKVVLLNVYSIAVPDPDPTVSHIMVEELSQNSKIGLHREVEWLDLEGPVEIEKRSLYGDSPEVILTEARKVKATWIVAGMKGAGRIARKIFGGTAFWLSRHSDIPLILVPENAWFTIPKTIALASDIDHGTDIRILDPLEEFGVKCRSKMYVVRVIKKGMDELVERLLRPSRIKWHCKELPTSFEFRNDRDVAHAMNEFVEEHSVHMIAMIAQEHDLLEKVFVKSEIKEMMSLTKVPLIVLPGKVKTVAAREFPAGLPSKP
jgi:nucleotide-binding universal stress UspA family protein